MGILKIQKTNNVLFIILYLVSQMFSSMVVTYDSSNFYCNNRIYVDTNLITSSDINSLCTSMTTDDRFTLLITSKIYFNNEYSYISNSETFFNQQCTNNANNCDVSFGISIYLRGGKVVITSGSIAKTIVNENERNNVINSMIIYLKDKLYVDAIKIGLKTLSNLFYSNGGSNYNPQYNPHGGSTTHSSGHPFLTFLFFLIIIACCCFCCYYIYKSKQESNEELTYERVIDNNNNRAGDNNTYNKAIKIHHHLVELENIIKEIRMNNPQMKSVNICLICMRQIIGGPGELESTSTRFKCQHVYHTACLNEFYLNHCIMCEDNDENCRNVIPNKYDSQVLYEEHVKNFIKKLNLIYPNEELKTYAETYPSEYRSYNDGLMVGMLASCWCMPPVIITQPAYYGYGMGYPPEYPPPPGPAPGPAPMSENYDMNPNVNSAVGNFSPTEMQDFNSGGYNNNSNNVGNFGGSNSNNVGNFDGGHTNDIGNFGGGNTNDYGDFGGDFGGDF